MDNTKFKLEG